MKPDQYSILIFLFVCFSFLPPLVLPAQQLEIDSISHLIRQFNDTSSQQEISDLSIVKAADWLREVQDSSYHFKYYYALGKYYYRQNADAKALKSFEAAHDLLVYEPEGPSQFCNILRYLGLSALEIPLKTRAISFLEQAILCFKQNDYPKKEIEKTAFRLFQYLYDFEEYDAAIKLGKQLPRLFDEVNSPRLDYVELYTSMALCYLALEDLKMTKLYIDRGEKELKKVKKEKIPLEEIRLRGTKIQYILETDDSGYTELVGYMDEWAEEFDHQNASSREKIGFYYRQAGYRAMAYQYDKAMEAADSLIAINNVRDKSGRLIVPELTNRRNSTYFNLVHAEIAVRLYEINRDTSLLRRSLKSIKSNFEIYNYNRRTLFDMSERKESLDMIYNSVKYATLIYWKCVLAGIIPPEDFWELSEKYRTSYLKEFKYARELESVYQEMEPSLKEKEQNLLDSLYNIQKNEDLKEKDRAVYFETVSRILSELYEYQQEIGQKFPEYYTQRLEQKYPSIPHIQSQLDSHQVMIEFMDGKSPGLWPSVYAFIISTDTFRIESIDTVDLKTTTDEYYKRIRNNPLQIQDRDEMIQSIVEIDSLGQFLRQELFDPLDIYEYEEWIVIPHEYLYYLPIITLPLTDEPTNNLAKSAQRARMADKYKVKYAYSAQWWIEGNQNSMKGNRNGIALLPAKSSNMHQLGFREDQLFTTNSNWKTKYYHKDTPFEKELEKANFDLLYIAAHAKYLQEEEETKIFFDPDNPLPSRAISKWPLRGKQVVLAACEGQLGARSNAEGMISLSYYLAAAGAHSITGALWEVADQSTRQILTPERFPKLNMDAAQIQHSINSYRSQASAIHQHPYFWGGFWTFQQNTQKVTIEGESNQNQLPWLIALAGAYLLFIVYLIKKKKI